MTVHSRLKQGSKRAATALGVPKTAQRRLYELVTPGMRRDRRDNEHIRLLLAFTLAPDSNCVDVGAANGHLLQHMVNLAPGGHHIAYEPLPHLHEGLARNFPDVDVRNVALSNETGAASFVHVKTDPGYSGFRERTYPRAQSIERISVRRETLDSALPSGYVPRLIKIDVEGAEREVLEGGIETIARHKPIVVFEHGKGASDAYGTHPSHVYDLLVRRAGLRVFDVDGRGPYSEQAFDEVFSQPIWTFVART